MKRMKTDGFLQQQEITVPVIMIPALMQTHFCPEGETLDRQWVGKMDLTRVRCQTKGEVV